MKLSWSTGIVIACILFAAGMLVMVYISMNRDVDLVAEDYYEQELNHQQHIDRVNRTVRTGMRPAVTVTTPVISIGFSPFIAGNRLRGSLTFYRPSDRTMDLSVPIDLDSSNTQVISTSLFAKGLWRLKLRWMYDGADYSHEHAFILE